MAIPAVLKLVLQSFACMFTLVLLLVGTSTGPALGFPRWPSHTIHQIGEGLHSLWQRDHCCLGSFFVGDATFYRKRVPPCWHGLQPIGCSWLHAKPPGGNQPTGCHGGKWSPLNQFVAQKMGRLQLPLVLFPLHLQPQKGHNLTAYQLVFGWVQFPLGRKRSKQLLLQLGDLLSELHHICTEGLHLIPHHLASSRKCEDQNVSSWFAVFASLLLTPLDTYHSSTSEITLLCGLLVLVKLLNRLVLEFLEFWDTPTYPATDTWQNDEPILGTCCNQRKKDASLDVFTNCW